jgi:hypothetical protein
VSSCKKATALYISINIFRPRVPFLSQIISYIAMPEPTYPKMAYWIEWFVGTASNVGFPPTTVLNEATGLELTTLEWSKKLATAATTVFKRDVDYVREYMVSNIKAYLTSEGAASTDSSSAALISDISETKELPGN